MNLYNCLKLLIAKRQIFPVIPKELQYGKTMLVNMEQPFWQELCKTAQLRKPCWHHIENFLCVNNALIAVGAYADIRNNIYQGKQLLIHLGIDLIVPPNTPVYAPLSGIIKKIMINNSLGDYGVLVIIEHNLNNTRFFTLYGHLSYESCLHLKPQQNIAATSIIGRIGNEQENGGWPPHLHLQISSEQLINNSNFFGAVDQLVAKEYLTHCPNPNLLLKMEINNMEKYYLEDLCPGVDLVRIGKWYTKDGDFVVKGNKIADFETNKINFEVYTPISGRVLKIYGLTGNDVDNSKPIVLIEEMEEAH
ncbi:MAG: hypothetical protein A2X12_10275 [Bacteroidetes bacterium GWE2_29_8]|nr:MAG: hypothetical protein A2X12_10275 [Bacteroidetes bacterium GWE2_29_8]